MSKRIPLDFLRVIRSKQERGCGVKIIFSDRTHASYPPEELASLRPHREPVSMDLRVSLRLPA
jgi:hypothetical protein